MQSASDEFAPSTSQQDTKSISSGQNRSAKKNNGLNLQILALNNIPPWAKLVLGSIVILAIPLCRRVLRTQDFKKTVEAAVEAVETAAEAADKVVEAAERVAEAVEKVMGGLVEALPSGSINEVAIKLEEIAAFVDKNAEVADSLIDMVVDVVDGLEIKMKLNNGEEKRASVKKLASATLR